MNMKSVQAVRSKNRNLKPTARAYAYVQTDRQIDRQTDSSTQSAATRTAACNSCRTFFVAM